MFENVAILLYFCVYFHAYIFYIFITLYLYKYIYFYYRIYELAVYIIRGAKYIARRIADTYMTDRRFPPTYLYLSRINSRGAVTSLNAHICFPTKQF